MPLEKLTGKGSLKRYFDSDYIGAYSLDPGTEPILTIDSFWYGDVTLAGGRKEPHVVIMFKEKTVPGVEEVKPLILNATNRKALKKAYGSDAPDELMGKTIRLYIDPKVRDPQDGGFTEGIRIRPSKPTIKCEACRGEIQAYKNTTAPQIAAHTKEKYGKQLCSECATKMASEVTKDESDEQ